MKRTLLFALCFSLTSTILPQIIADHTVVDKYVDIPQFYIDEVKKMWLSYAGESHSLGIRVGMRLLEEQDPKYAVSVLEGSFGDTPEPYTTANLRVSRATWGDVDYDEGWVYYYGEEDWYGSPTAINRTKAGLNYYNTIGPYMAAFGFGWCWDPDETNMTTYLNATQQYIDYCTNNGYATTVFFTTGPVDWVCSEGETGYLKYLAYKAIRDYVALDESRILFDYADILYYDADGSTNIQTWNGHDYPIITETNLLPVDENYHISETGALRLAKAMWWMLARIAGWDGNIGSIPAESIIVTGAGGATTITQDNGTLALTATVLPTNATTKTVTWSITNGTGQATISATGVVTAVANGTVTARATATDGSGVYGELVITITNQVIPVTGITVTGAGGATTITQDNGTLALTATVLPTNATTKTVTWSITNGTGQATISATGVVTAVANGTVTARATATDGSGVYGELVITITNQVVPVTGITVTGAGGATTITQDNGTLALTATVLPTNATNKTVTWSITNGTGQATISATGVVTAVANGTVTARATATDGSGVYGELVITISGQIIPVTSITVTGAGGATTITQDNGTLALTATVLPTNATTKTVTWSITNGTGQATISATGVVTAVANGTVTARATATDGSGVYGQLVITISGQIIPVTGITVTGAGGSSVITTDGGQLQLTATVTPSDATNKTVTWSITNGTGQATISATGVVTAVANGTVTARATATDGSGVYGQLVITISGQIIPVTGITVTGAGGSSVITTDGGQLQLTATVTPSDATNKTVTWSITNGTGQATINTTGLVTAVSSGTVTAIATANDGSGVQGTLAITISNQIIPVTSITVTGAGGATTITQDNGTLALTATVLPTNATTKTVTWSITNGTGQATINTTGLVTSVSSGTVTAIATANDGSGVQGTLVITITNQLIPVTSITVTGAGGATTITQDDGTLALTAAVLPANATNKTVTWSLVSGNGHAQISDDGLLTARSNGTVLVRATANDGSNIYGQIEITITNQIVPVTSIKIKVKIKAATTTTVNDTLELIAEVLPEDATDKNVSWSIINGTGSAVISKTGVLTGISPGEVTVVASSMDGSGVIGELAITIELVESIKIHYNRNELTVQVPERLIPAKASLHNLYGSHIQTKIVDASECIFDITGLLPGVYIVSVYNTVVQDATKIIIAY
jgi:uncharacterized protein YjdB